MSSWFAFCAAQTREILHKYRANAASFILPPADNNELRLDIAGLKRNPFIQGLWKEALRLGTASAAARVVTKDSELGGFTVSRGSILLMPVILMHYDENVFPDSRQVKPERWMSDNEEKIATQNKQLRAFGGGASLCSGRFVAELEVISVVSIMLLRFDVEFDESSKNWEFNPRSVGVMGPTRAPIARLRPRNPYHRTG
jgi:oxysterol 7-alpha-hydroxylase